MPEIVAHLLCKPLIDCHTVDKRSIVGSYKCTTCAMHLCKFPCCIAIRGKISFTFYISRIRALPYQCILIKPIFQNQQRSLFCMSNKGRNRIHAACIHLCAFGRGLSLVIFLLSQQCAAQCAIGVHLLICIPQALQTSIECGIYFISKYFRIHKPRNLHNISQEWNDQNAFRNILYTTVILNEHVHRRSEKHFKSSVVENQ